MHQVPLFGVIVFLSGEIIIMTVKFNNEKNFLLKFTNIFSIMILHLWLK